MEILITALGSEGQGIGRLKNGKVVFVPKALPGEVVDIDILEENSKRAQGEIKEILKKSEDRIIPDKGIDLPGMNLCHMTYESQLKFKSQRVRECLMGIGGMSEEKVNQILKNIIPSVEITNYRNHMQYIIKDLKICMTQSSTNNAFPVDQCDMEYEVFGKVRKQIENALGNYPTTMFSGLVLRGSKRTKEILIEFICDLPNSNEILIQNAKDYLKATSLKEEIEKHIEDYRLNGILLRISKDKVQKRTRTGKRVVLEGKNYYDEILLGKKFRVEAGAFFQVNVNQAEKLYLEAKKGISDSRIVFDIYCGAGTIGLSVTDDSQILFGIESVPEAIKSAKVNAELNNNKDAKFILKQAEKVDFKKEKLPEPDAVVVDPPRKGMDIGFIAKLLDMAPNKIAYVSCDPATMARDLKYLSKDYEIISVTPVDMFANTSHVETVVQLSKGSVPSQDVKVKFSMENVSSAKYLDKPATYEQIKTYVKEHSGLNVSSLYIAQVKQKYGIIERDCYNLPKSNDSRQPKCPESKEKAIVEALKYFKMI